MSVARCPDCQRLFNLAVATDAEEWYYGHDCDESLTARKDKYDERD